MNDANHAAASAGTPASTETPASSAAGRRSEELTADLSTGITMVYQTFGDPADDPLLLVMGLGGPMTWWDEEFCDQLAAAGFYVIRYDNRDTGHSSSGEGWVTRGMVVKAFLGRPVDAPYSISDLASDGFALLDHLDISAAHIAGISMGGMIVQTMAIEHPERVLSMSSIMSTTGGRTVGWQHPRLFPALLAPRQTDRDAYIDSVAGFWKVIGSPAYPEPVERTRTKAATTFDRGINGPGMLRHMLAVLTQPNRSRALGEVTVPTLVMHGLADRMVHVSGGRATSTAIPGSELVLVDGMGHDLPPALWPMIIGGIRRTANKAT